MRRTGATKRCGSPMSPISRHAICPAAPISPGPPFPARIYRSPAPAPASPAHARAPSGGFMPCRRLWRGEGRAPRLIVLENVVGALTSKRRRGFCRDLPRTASARLSLRRADDRRRAFPAAIAAAAVHRWRAAGSCTSLRAWRASGRPRDSPRGALLRAQRRWRPKSPPSWRWWILPDPPRDQSSSRRLDRKRARRRFMAQRGADRGDDRDRCQRARARSLPTLRASGGRRFGALYRRTRPDGAGGKRMRAEARFDGLAGCLRTPGGGSSRQFLLSVEGERDPRRGFCRRARRPG